MSVRLKVLRTTNGDNFTEGKFFIDEVMNFYTIEDKDRELENGGIKVYGETAIPKGMYRVIISYSPRFKKDLIEILNVPQFTGIRIHPMNKAEQSEGCIGVGLTNERDDDNWIGHSRPTYERLHQKVKEALERGELVTLEVV